jgi:HSP20 family molecular chaperone IbpA
MADELTVKQESAVNEEETRPGRTYVPNVEIRETDDAMWLWADMPGVSQDSVDISLENGVLSIQGQVQTDDYADLTPAYTEYNVGNFKRSFSLSTVIDAEHIEAKMRSGVLELRLPKAEEARPQRIPISVGEQLCQLMLGCSALVDPACEGLDRSDDEPE